ncbi:FmdB family transcriptional regulator [Nocardiopsis sp. TSRI0078]|uniref:FmdB family zinc ribbon protein n=1 Tax=unclassified Nocardiopsis TaxID=2649073 RepID=UPI00093B84F9|nr:FmdB family zinc ribbon protein [Nocardiopsis sp. TSRI0078]OKI22002.1 FmdB family transcriptional regulator [Nocardiopsis sp. TSRI0078]
MPTYQYACTECSAQMEVVQSFSDDALTVCPECEGRLRKVYSAVGIVFKGSGFYRTDSGKSSNSSVLTGSGESKDGGDSAASGSSDSSSDTKSTSSGSETGTANASGSTTSTGTGTSSSASSSSTAAAAG